MPPPRPNFANQFIVAQAVGIRESGMSEYDQRHRMHPSEIEFRHHHCPQNRSRPWSARKNARRTCSCVLRKPFEVFLGSRRSALCFAGIASSISSRFENRVLPPVVRNRGKILLDPWRSALGYLLAKVSANLTDLLKDVIAIDILIRHTLVLGIFFHCSYAAER